MNKENEIIYWNELKSKLKQRYPQLSNSDLQWRNTTQKDILEMIASKLGKTTSDLEEEMLLFE